MQHNNNSVFNVIFIPNTVDYQSIALLSLLQYSDLNFRLVGNALGAEEARLLRQISVCSPRLSFVNFESETIIPHGTLLDLLMTSESSDLFCFCDSDLFLFEPLYFHQVLEHMKDAVVFSSGGRIENQDDATYAGFKGGATTISQDRKIDLATSFFCVYRRQPVVQISLETHVGFEQFRSLSQIPQHIRSQVLELAPEFEMFDTGKLLSVLLHRSGYTKVYKEIEGLNHIGGMSGRYLQQLNIENHIELNEAELPQVSVSKDKDLNLRNEYEKSLKRFYGKYFYCFLNHLIGKGPKPDLIGHTDRVVNTIKDLEIKMLKVVEQTSQDPARKKIWDLVRQ